MNTDTNLGDLRAPVAQPHAAGTCWHCKGDQWLKCYWPPYGKHHTHAPECQKGHGYCLRKCPDCANGIRAGQITPQLYTWLGDDPGDLPYKRLDAFTRVAQPKAYDAARAWLAAALANERGLKNLILAGNPGTGKTHLVAALANALQDANIACLFCVAPSFFKSYYAATFEDKSTLMRRASEIAVLVLDDLDKVHVTDSGYQENTLFEMLNNRYNAHKPTLITTNAEHGLKKWLNEATISRLVGRGILLSMNGTDYRQRKDGMK